MVKNGVIENSVELQAEIALSNCRAPAVSLIFRIRRFMLVTNLVKIFTNAWWPMSARGCEGDLLALRSAGLVNL
jgi:hypothetical protein